MLLTPVGEDTLVICEKCDYRANMEAAESVVNTKRDEISQPLTLVHTPQQKTIEDVAAFLKTSSEKCCKAIVYQRKADNSYIVVFIRGDLDLQETKLLKYIGSEIYPAAITEESALSAGYLGPIGLDKNVTALFDASLKGANNLVCGGNKDEEHYTGFDIERDLAGVEYHDFARVFEGGICPNCGQAALVIARGIEVGNIFQLGTKYSQSMNMHYTDSEGKTHLPIMGCYGIGVGRLAASVCEARHDDYGPIWPMSIAPWQVHICALKVSDPQVAEIANGLYSSLQNAGIEVIFDDRAVSPGFMFSDADLLGVPVRVVVSPKNCKENVVEVSKRDKTLQEKVSAESAAEYVKNLVAQELRKYNGGLVK
jgi:prolyl-tRNA synthetase